MTAAILEAGKWIDAGLQNKNKMAETIADKSYVNTSVDAINQRILGRYTNGLGKTWDDPNHMKFYNDGAVNFPYLSDGMWFLTQHKRWGLLKEHPDYLERGHADQPASTSTSRPPRPPRRRVPKDAMRTSKLIDGVVWDGKDPKKYAESFKVHAGLKEHTMVSAVFHSPLEAAPAQLAGARSRRHVAAASPPAPPRQPSPEAGAPRAPRDLRCALAARAAADPGLRACWC